MKITEPTTMLTDYALAVLSTVFGVSLFRRALHYRQVSVGLWAAAFSATAIAAVSGGTAHGFKRHLGDATERALWKMTLYLLGPASFFMLSGVIVASISRPLQYWFLAASMLKLFFFFAWWMRSCVKFRDVIYDYGLGMIGVLFLACRAALRVGAPSSPPIIGGVLVSFVAAGIQQNRLALHKHFNHNDLYHVVQIGALYLFYRGARLLCDR